MNYLNFLSNFVTIFWIRSCMIISDKQMKHLHLRPAARPEFDSKAADNLFLFSRRNCRKRFHIFFFFFLLSEKLPRYDPRLFSCFHYSYFSNNFFYISSKRVLHMVTQSREFCGILIPELRNTKKTRDLKHSLTQMVNCPTAAIAGKWQTTNKLHSVRLSVN